MPLREVLKFENPALMNVTSSWVSEMMSKHSERRALTRQRETDSMTSNQLSVCQTTLPLVVDPKALKKSISVEVSQITPIKVLSGEPKNAEPSNLPAIFVSQPTPKNLKTPSDKDSSRMPEISLQASIDVSNLKSEDELSLREMTIPGLRPESRRYIMPDLPVGIKIGSALKLQKVEPDFHASLSLKGLGNGEPVLAPIEQTAAFATFKKRQTYQSRFLNSIDLTKEINDMLQLDPQEAPSSPENNTEDQESSRKGVLKHPSESLRRSRTMTHIRRGKKVTFSDVISVREVAKVVKKTKAVGCFCFF